MFESKVKSWVAWAIRLMLVLTFVLTLVLTLVLTSVPMSALTGGLTTTVAWTQEDDGRARYDGRPGSEMQALLEWTWDSPPHQLTPVVADDGQTYTRVTLEGYLNDDTPGWPSLPVVGELLALPPTGDFALEVVEVVYDTVALDHPVEPAPAPAPLQFDADGQPLPGEWAFARDERAYASAAPYPAAFAALDDPAWMREQRVARLTITPFRYRPARQALDVLRRLRLRVVQVGGEADSLHPAKRSDDPATTSPAASPFDALDVINPADLLDFRAARAPVEPQVAPGAPGAYKVFVETEGLYELSYQILAPVDVPVDSIDPATLRLFYRGEEVAAYWDGDDDAVFEYGERLLFYARPQTTRYAGHDAYWLSWGGEPGRRMGTRSGDPAGLPARTAWTTQLFEENVMYDSLYPGWDGDRWFWRSLRKPDVLSQVFTLSLPTPDAGAAGALTIWLQGTTRSHLAPDHHVRFSLNGELLGDAWWEGKTPYTATLDLPAGLLVAGDNVLTLTQPDVIGAHVEGAHVDAMTITYGLSAAVSGGLARFGGRGNAGAYAVGGFSGLARDDLRVYDVSDPNAPLVLSDWTLSGDGVVSVGDSGSQPSEYLIEPDDEVRIPLAIIAAAPYSDPPEGADYVVVTHARFETALAPLLAHRAAQGLRTALVETEAIYDHFGDGRMDPQAIKAFLSHAYANWAGDPLTYVLLVGDATYDPRGYQVDSNPTFLPAYLDDVDPWMGETATDHWYADLTGDDLPDLRLGRLPVNTADEASAVVEKIVTYEAHPLPERWNDQLLFGADNPSTAGDHHADSDSEYETYATPAYGYRGTRVYFSETAGEPHLYTQASAAQDALIAAFNQGALLYTYFGHASWHQEAVLETDNYAPLFHLDHISRLDNARRWPVMLHMTCFTGRYVYPDGDTLDESLLRAQGVGAVGVWGSSGNGLAPGHSVLHRTFYQSVFDSGDDEQPDLGASIHAALAALYADGVYRDLIYTYHLFGDPAMRLNMTILDWPYAIFLPVVTRDAP
ncbi:MAG TPA: hypothetical protein ENN19_02730 [Chloroflexi bacterium]|nr:hypothetical protein [Chloroflexota bacterium]